MPTIKKPARWKPKKTFKAQARQKIYQSQKWKELRQAKLMTNPLCEDCLEKGIITPAEDVHHLKSPFDYYDQNTVESLAYDPTNLRSLCKVCHGIRHGHGKNTSLHS